MRLAKYSYIYIYIQVHGGVSRNDPQAAKHPGGGDELAVELEDLQLEVAKATPKSK